MKKLFPELRKQWVLQAMALPAVVWLLVFAYVPMFGIIIAFKDYRIIDNFFTAPWTHSNGFGHFIEAFEDPDFIASVVNTLQLSVLKLLIGFPLPIIFALLMNELYHMRFKKWVQTITYLPHFLSWIILGGMMISWLSSEGFINSVLLSMGLVKEPIRFLSEPSLFFPVAIFSDIWKELGWNSIIYIAAIAGVDPVLYEAAKIDGASRFQRSLHITLPSIRGTIIILLILSVSSILNTNFEQILVLGNPLNYAKSNVIDIFVYNRGIINSEFSFATAVGLFKAVISVTLLIIAHKMGQKLSGRGLY